MIKEGIQRDEVQIKRRPLIKEYEEEYVREVQRLRNEDMNDDKYKLSKNWRLMEEDEEGRR